MARPQRYELIVFDWDGTLMDSAAAIVRAIQAASADLGLPPPSDARARHVIGLGLQDALHHAVPELPEADYPKMVERYRHHYLSSDHELTLFDGTQALIADLHARGHLLAVATGKSRRGLDEALDTAGLRHLFDATRTADQTAGKPDPLMLHELMDELNTTPVQTLMVGDTSHDLLMAHNAACAAVAVTYGAHDASGLLVLRPLHVAPSIAGLQQWLLQHG